MEQLTKEQLLAKAKEMYPIGTKYLSESKTECFVKGNFYLFSLMDGGFQITDGNGGSIFLRDKWAEIISTPKQHDGYIVPFDIKLADLKKGDIIRNKKDGTSGFDNKNTWENILVLNSYHVLPSEIVETWEKHYPENTEETKPDYSKVIELIEGEIEENKKQENESKFFESSLYNIRRKALQDILTKIKAL